MFYVKYMLKDLRRYANQWCCNNSCSYHNASLRSQLSSITVAIIHTHQTTSMSFGTCSVPYQTRTKDDVKHLRAKSNRKFLKGTPCVLQSLLSKQQRVDFVVWLLNHTCYQTRYKQEVRHLLQCLQSKPWHRSHITV